MRRDALAIPELSREEIDRFWSRVAVGSQDTCWVWRRGMSMGYGVFSLSRDGKSYDFKAHRLAYFLTHRQLDLDQCVCHKCDNPPCCNPAHLFAGTLADNMRDCHAKGRLKIATEKVRGEEHWMHKLTESEVKEIRRLYALGDVSQRALANQFRVTQANIGCIIRRHTWASL
jgi:HNH endonuclease